MMKQEEDTIAPHQRIIYTPISWLRANLSNWNIKARITNKSKNIQKFYNQQKQAENQVFSIDIIDREKNELKGSFFGEICNEFFYKLEIGKIYRFSKGHIKKAQGTFGNKDGIQVQFGQFSEIEELEEDDSIPINNYTFTKIKELKNMKQGQTVDALGIIVEKSRIQQFQSKGKIVDKLDITIADDTGYKIQIGFWGEDVKLHKYEIGDCLILKQVKINQFKQTLILSTLFGSLIYLNNYDLPQCKNIMDWYKQHICNNGGKINSNSFKFLIKIDQEIKKSSLFEVEQNCLLKAQQELDQEQKIFSTCKAQIKGINFSQSLYYLSCPNNDCKRKIIFNNEISKYRCEFCQNEYDQPYPRYIAMINIQDSSGNLWIKVFDDIANQLFVISADGLKQLKEQQTEESENKIKKLLQESIGREFLFQISSKIQFYNQMPQIKHNVIQIEEINEVSESQKLLVQINQLIHD